MDATDDPLLELDNQLCFAVYAAQHAFTRVYKPLLDGLGLTYPQYLVMLVLWQGDDLTVKALGERLDLDSGTLTPLLKRLETAGLVERHRDARDERQVRLLLTSAGRALRGQAHAVPRAVLDACACTPAELGGLRDQLKALRRHLLAAEA